MQADNSINTLLEIMKQLRDPERGCSWDKKQDFVSIAPYTVEEAYEVADAIERNDMVDLVDELGDLLLQVVFHAQMAAEMNAFDFSDVVESINKKMIRRHPHIFGENKNLSPQEVKQQWEAIKQEEQLEKKRKKAQIGSQQHLRKETYISDIPNNLPALTRAYKISQKAVQVGFEWETIDDVFDKLDEEKRELQEAILSNNQDHIEEEMGDLLFVAVNLSRKCNIHPEQAMHRFNRKFIDRFSSIENRLADQGLSLEEASLEQMEAAWQNAKNPL